MAYSDVDIIGHTNNARYIVLAMDCIDYDIAVRQPVKEVFIVFSRETNRESPSACTESVRRMKTEGPIQSKAKWMESPVSAREYHSRICSSSSIHTIPLRFCPFRLPSIREV